MSILQHNEYTEKNAQEIINKCQSNLFEELDFWMDHYFGNWPEFRRYLETETDCRGLLKSYFIFRLVMSLKRDNESQSFIISELIDFAYSALENNVLLSSYFIDTIIEIRRIPQLKKYHADISCILVNFLSLAEKLKFKLDTIPNTSIIELSGPDLSTSFTEYCKIMLNVNECEAAYDVIHNILRANIVTID